MRSAARCSCLIWLTCTKTACSSVACLFSQKNSRLALAGAGATPGAGPRAVNSSRCWGPAGGGGRGHSPWPTFCLGWVGRLLLSSVATWATAIRWGHVVCTPRDLFTCSAECWDSCLCFWVHTFKLWESHEAESIPLRYRRMQVSISSRQ